MLILEKVQRDSFSSFTHINLLHLRREKLVEFLVWKSQWLTQWANRLYSNNPTNYDRVHYCTGHSNFKLNVHLDRHKDSSTAQEAVVVATTAAATMNSKGKNYRIIHSLVLFYWLYRFNYSLHDQRCPFYETCTQARYPAEWAQHEPSVPNRLSIDPFWHRAGSFRSHRSFVKPEHSALSSLSPTSH